MDGRGRVKSIEVGSGGHRVMLALVGVGLVGALLYRPLPPSSVRSRPDIHAEYVKFPSGRDTITGYLAYPERKDRAPAVVVIHEIFGMSDFVRHVTEQLAQDGFVAIAPDLLSRRGGTPGSPDSAVKLIGGLNGDTLTKDLDATVAYVKRLKAVRPERVGVIGFCWGGGQSFRYATNNPSLRAFVVCYGPGPDALAIARIRARGLGVYAENDARIDAGLPDVDGAVRTYHKDYHYTVYPGVGHGFLRTREKPEVADSAWGNVIRFLRETLER
jgi:carboxymethylenebutenolidase